MNASWALAWRNIWRNRRRTWLTVGAMVFSNIFLVFLIAVQLGSYDMMIENTLRTFTGHLQVQHTGYQDNPKMRRSIPDIAKRAQALRESTGLSAIAARAEGFALASSEERSFGVQVLGVQSQFEPLVSTLPGLLGEGRWFSGDDAEEVIVGSVLARNLKVGLGDEITFLGSARDGSFAAGVVKVTGILHSGFTAVDRSVVQMPLGYFDTVFGMEGQGHRIVIEAPELGQVPQYLPRVRDALDANEELVVLDWDTLEPGLRQAIRADMTSAWIIYAILIVLVAFSVLNTQLMSVMERTREFGTLLALGIRPGHLGGVVVRETFLMAVLGLALGVALGALLSGYFLLNGVTLPGMEEAAQRFNMSPVIYPQISFLSLFWGPLTVFVGTMLAAVYPALRLQRLEPVPAMRAV